MINVCIIGYGYWGPNLCRNFSNAQAAAIWVCDFFKFSKYKKNNYIFGSTHTNDLKSRLEKHNNNKGAKSTKGYKWLLIYSKKFKSKNAAMSFEYKLKKNRSLRKKILTKIL
jgi:putative endonuclease